VNELKTISLRLRLTSVKHLCGLAVPGLLLASLLAGADEDLAAFAADSRAALIADAGPKGCCDREPTGSVPSGAPLPEGRRRLAVPIALTGREPVCALALNPASDGAARALSNVDVVLEGCRLFSNSASASAVSLPYSVRLSALAIGAVGGVVSSEGVRAVLGVSTGNAPVLDPYRALAVPDFSGCDRANFTVTSSAIAEPGVYCGGMVLAPGADLVLKPGLYIFDQGSLSVASGARLSGSGVTLVFTSSRGRDFAKARFSPGASVHLEAAATGSTAGIVIFGDRRMPLGQPFDLEGGEGQVFAGVTYVPRAALRFAGTSLGCTPIIADTITFTGPTRLSRACAGSAQSPSPVPSAEVKPALYWLTLDRPTPVSPSAP
jgi:hypothetical protein